MITLSNEPMWSFESLRSINTQGRFTHFDYARVLRQSGKLDPEILLQWLKSYAPPLIEHNGRIYLAEQFSTKEFEDVRRRVASDSDAQLFLNLVNVTDLLGEESDAFLPDIAEQMTANWNAQLLAQYPSHLDRVQTLLDDGEYYICIVRS